MPLYRLTSLPPWDDEGRLWRLELEWAFRTDGSGSGGDPVIYQPQGYTRMPDGTLIVLDGWEQRLVVVDPVAGQVLGRFAPSGQGPGEIRSSNSALWPASDTSVWVLDPGNLRLSRFGLSGTLHSERRIDMSGMGGVTLQRVGSGEPWSWRVFLEDPATGVLSDSVGLFRADQGEMDFVAPLPDRPVTSQRNTSRTVLFDAMGWFAPVHKRRRRRP